MKKRHEYFVYIVASITRVLYIGMTNSLAHRTFEHKEGRIPGFSKRYNRNRLVYYEMYGEVGLAIRREKQLKGFRREKKIRLIESMNPTWQDLAIH